MIRFSKNVTDRRNAISTASVSFTFRLKKAAIPGHDHARSDLDQAKEQSIRFAIMVARKTSVSDVACSPHDCRELGSHVAISSMKLTVN